jgi:hypothetical protein
MPFTPNFAIPYQTMADAPHGPNLGESGFLAVDAALSGLDVRVDALEAAVKYTKIAESVLTGTAASVTFSSIPASFRTLEIRIQARSDTAATATPLVMRFNADSGANYDSQSIFGQTTSTGATESVAATGMSLLEIAAASATANHAGALTLFIPNYNGTTFIKTADGTSTSSVGTGAGTLITRKISGRWRSTAAITSITVLPAAGNFVAGSSFVLYGLP